jgi:hypothetical protein
MGKRLVQEAKGYLQDAVHRVQHGEGGTSDYDLARMQLWLGRIFWALRGQVETPSGNQGDREGPGPPGETTEDNAASAHSCWLAAATVAGPDQATCFAWLGEWYRVVPGDAGRAGKCFRRAITLDPKEEVAGGCLDGPLKGDSPGLLRDRLLQKCTQCVKQGRLCSASS